MQEINKKIKFLTLCFRTMREQGTIFRVQITHGNNLIRSWTTTAGPNGATKTPGKTMNIK